MYNRTIKKLIGLAFTLVITIKVFAQLNNCINTKEHPLIEEIIDSVKTNRNYNSILAYTVIKGNQLGLARSTILNLAYAWATCKKIMDPLLRKDEEFKFLDKILCDYEIEKLLIYELKYLNQRRYAVLGRYFFDKKYINFIICQLYKKLIL